MKIVAVIVTRGRTDLLAACLAAVLGQSRAVDLAVVVDNNDDPAVCAALRERHAADDRVRFYQTEANLGGAGGFAAGIRLALHHGADQVWLMDDDVLPAADALGRLVATHDHFAPILPLGFVCSRVVWTDGSAAEMNRSTPQADWDRWYSADWPVASVQTATFVSLLLPREVILRKGLPAAAFFIWYDDNDYTLRITADMVGLCALSSVAVHRMAVNAGADFRAVTAANLWKYRYGVRNEIATVRTHFGLAAAAMAAMRLCRRVATAPGLAAKLALAAALVRGFIFRYEMEMYDPARAFTRIRTGPPRPL
ncbi:MAG TPA: glycosyltransferase [Acetobacteraceae bacterium]|nr:glycosyltransferase [Acetobacteraceae bacterium]